MCDVRGFFFLVLSWASQYCGVDWGYFYGSDGYGYTHSLWGGSPFVYFWGLLFRGWAQKSRRNAKYHLVWLFLYIQNYEIKMRWCDVRFNELLHDRFRCFFFGCGAIALQ